MGIVRRHSLAVALEVGECRGRYPHRLFQVAIEGPWVVHEPRLLIGQDLGHGALGHWGWRMSCQAAFGEPGVDLRHIPPALAVRGLGARPVGAGSKGPPESIYAARGAARSAQEKESETAGS